MSVYRTALKNKVGTLPITYALHYVYILVQLLIIGARNPCYRVEGYIYSEVENIIEIKRKLLNSVQHIE